MGAISTFISLFFSCSLLSPRLHGLPLQSTAGAPAVSSFLSPPWSPSLPPLFFLSPRSRFLSLSSLCSRRQAIEQLWSSSRRTRHWEEFRRCRNVWAWPGSEQITIVVAREYEWQSRAFTETLRHSPTILTTKLSAKMLNITSSSQWYPRFTTKMLGLLARFSMQNDETLTVYPSQTELCFEVTISNL